MGKKQEMDETANPTVYRRCYKDLVTRRNGGCSFCRWHRNENATRQSKRGHRKLNKIHRRG
ncbi:hypothetical protein [Holophaga foetida]|uniref:hypothetical protein n=1 Tax=Holophaga foetida TaxID=35839 RepID=UPI0002472117|nr:hypothetical protein [Holophaga foetida]